MRWPWQRRRGMRVTVAIERYGVIVNGEMFEDMIMAYHGGRAVLILARRDDTEVPIYIDQIMILVSTSY